MHVLFAISRVLLVLIFVFLGGQKLFDIPTFAALVEKAVAVPDALQDIVGQLEGTTGMKWPHLLTILIGAVEVVGGLLIAFNIATRGAAFVLAIFTLVATYYFHAFWNMSGVAVQETMIHALKNLSILGGLLTFVVLGSWRPAPSNQI